MTLDDAEGFAAQPDIQPLASIDRPVVAVPEQWQTVGHLYRGIEAGLARLCGRYGEDAVFIGPPDTQAVTATFAPRMAASKNPVNPCAHFRARARCSGPASRGPPTGRR
jgi:hypothetical protein